MHERANTDDYPSHVLLESMDEVIENLRNGGMLETEEQTRAFIAELRDSAGNCEDPLVDQSKRILEELESNANSENRIKSLGFQERPYWNCHKAYLRGLSALHDGGALVVDAMENPGAQSASLAIGVLFQSELKDMIIDGLSIVRHRDLIGISEHLHARMRLSDKFKIWRDKLSNAITLAPALHSRLDANTRKPESSAIDQAYGAAVTFIDDIGTLAYSARHWEPTEDDPESWKRFSGTYGAAFIAWFDLTHLLTPEVRESARRVYPAGSPSIRLGKLRPTATVIEAVAENLGGFFRNVIYQDLRHPLEPDTMDKADTRAAVRQRLGIKTLGDGQMFMAREWESMDRSQVNSVMLRLRCESINFDDLKVQLGREIDSISSSQSNPDAQIGFDSDGISSSKCPEQSDAGKPAVSKKKRPARTSADIARDEGNIAAHIADNPDTTRDAIAEAIGIAKAHVSDSKAWNAFRAAKKEQRKASRARGTGGDDCSLKHVSDHRDSPPSLTDEEK